MRSKSDRREVLSSSIFLASRLPTSDIKISLYLVTDQHIDMFASPGEMEMR